MNEQSSGAAATEEQVDGPPERAPKWVFFGKKVPRTEIVFVAQVFIVYVVVIVSLINLTREHGTATLWTTLLASCLGYLLPNPRLNAEEQ
jgi:hypothetical protein